MMKRDRKYRQTMVKATDLLRLRKMRSPPIFEPSRCFWHGKLALTNSVGRMSAVSCNTLSTFYTVIVLHYMARGSMHVCEYDIVIEVGAA